VELLQWGRGTIVGWRERGEGVGAGRDEYDEVFIFKYENSIIELTKNC
jgi:hypothetical protein